MEDKDFIKEVFQEKLGNFESPVDASAWTNISSQLSTSVVSTSAASSMGVVSKFVAAAVIISGVIGGVILLEKEEIANDNVVALEEKSELFLEKKEQDMNKVESISELSEMIPLKDTKLNKEEVVEDKVQDPVLSDLVEDPVIDVKPMIVPKFTPIVYKPVEPETPVSAVIIAEKLKEENLEEEIILPVVESNEDIVVEKTIELYNVITPNSDGVNDYLFVEIEDVREFNLVLLNNKHEVVFKTSDVHFKWSGYSMFGDKLPAGEYFYFVTGVYNSGNTFQQHSPLTINY
jgi:hypothetical protein